MTATFLACALVAGVIAAAATTVAPSANAEPAPCAPTHSIVVGGMEVRVYYPLLRVDDYTESASFTGDTLVSYHTLNPEQGIAALDAAVNTARTTCPATHLRIVGHSMGAAVVHIWAQRHPGYPNTNLVLLADPKRAPGPGAGGLAGIPAAWLLGPPIMGVDSNFGGIPTLTVCDERDIICEASTTPRGYMTGAHQAYSFDAADYDDTTTGVLYR